jgi:hypothetical protein
MIGERIRLRQRQKQDQLFAARSGFRGLIAIIARPTRTRRCGLRYRKTKTGSRALVCAREDPQPREQRGIM